MTDFWKEFFELLKSVLSNVASFFMGYKMGENEREKLIAKADALKIEMARLENEKKIREANFSKSDSQLIDDAVRDGSKVPK